MKIGLFGGSFEPIHLGHLILAERCRDKLALDLVKFIVANISPFKVGRTPLDNKHRLEMVRLATNGNPAFECDDLEVRRGGISYTIDTAQSVLESHPGAELFLLMGADSLRDFGKWREPEKLLELVTPVVISRGGVADPEWSAITEFVQPERLEQIRRAQVTSPKIEISSTEIRRRLSQNESVRYLVPSAVDIYIQQHRLFMDSSPTHTSS